MRFKLSPAFLQELDSRGMKPEKLKGYLRRLVKGYKHNDLRVLLRSQKLSRGAWSGIYYPSEKRAVVTVQKEVLLPTIVQGWINRGKRVYVGIETFEELVGWGFLHEFHHYTEDRRGWKRSHWKNYLWCLKRLYTEGGRFELLLEKSICRLCGFQMIHPRWKWNTFFAHLACHLFPGRKALELLAEGEHAGIHDVFAEAHALCKACLSETSSPWNFECDKHKPKAPEEPTTAEMTLEKEEKIGVCPDCRHFLSKEKAMREETASDWISKEFYAGYCRLGKFRIFADSINKPCRSFSEKARNE